MRIEKKMRNNIELTIFLNHDFFSSAGLLTFSGFTDRRSNQINPPKMSTVPMMKNFTVFSIICTDCVTECECVCVSFVQLYRRRFISVFRTF